MTSLLLVVFLIGYLLIIFEYHVKINKTASSLVLAIVLWALLFMGFGEVGELESEKLNEYVGNVSQIIFFLLGAMTLVEIIDSHKGFRMVNEFVETRSKKKILWIIGLVAFFLSAVLDNLTTTILLVSLLRKLIIDYEERILMGAVVVIAANAGGAWTPIGDVTTTLLWINGQLTSGNIIRSLFLPSFFSFFVSLSLLSIRLKGNYHKIGKKAEKAEPGAKVVLLCGLGSLIFVPIFKSITGLPPFMGMMIALGALWMITDLIHHRHENRDHLRVPHVLRKIDTSGILFFLGILLSIHALEAIGFLKDLAVFLDQHVPNISVVATLIGLVSALIDNVPLVAACIGMYDLQTYPPDSFLWEMVAYAAGTGGSILIIGSAAGVALMGMEKIDFTWYFKKISLTALSGYLAGMALYLFIHML